MDQDGTFFFEFYFFSVPQIYERTFPLKLVYSLKSKGDRSYNRPEVYLKFYFLR